MKIHIKKVEIPDVLLIETDYFRDERGFFIESWHRKDYADAGFTQEFVQDNHSRSGEGVLRGFHYQDMTAPMGKLVRCTIGAIFDVVVDLRVGSPTFGKWYGVELSEENMSQLYVPVGCGHGFLTLSEKADVHYKCTGFYTPSSEGTVLWSDEDIGVVWPFPPSQLSGRDQKGMPLKTYLASPAFTYR